LSFDHIAITFVGKKIMLYQSNIEIYTYL
jgi:hypothetical protein